MSTPLLAVVTVAFVAIGGAVVAVAVVAVVAVAVVAFAGAVLLLFQQLWASAMCPRVNNVAVVCCWCLLRL